MSEPSILVENCSKSFSTKRVLKGLSLSLSPGSVFGLVGLNGAGKTTLIRILLGLLRADIGTCSVLGSNPADHDRALYRRVGVVLEHNGFFGNLSVSDNLSFFARARGISREEMTDYFSRYWADTDIGKDSRSVKFFSRGQKMQCALSRAFLGWPELYLLDEPVVALDVEAYDRFCTMITTARTQGATILISSHQLDAIEDLCTSVGILENGRIDLLENIQQKDHTEIWHIRTDDMDTHSSTIEEIVGERVQCTDGGCTFPVSEDHDRIIPLIVSRLVSQGAAIYEVRPAKKDVRASIKQYYNRNV